MRKRTQARECALQILYLHEMNPGPLDAIISAFWEEHPNLTEEVRGFAEILVRSTLEHLTDLDASIMKAVENWEINRMAVIDRSILRFSAYELLYMPDIPPKVTINEAVNIAKKFSQEESGKFVNGVLDKINHTEKTPPAAS